MTVIIFGVLLTVYYLRFRTFSMSWPLPPKPIIMEKIDEPQNNTSLEQEPCGQQDKSTVNIQAFEIPLISSKNAVDLQKHIVDSNVRACV